MSNTIKEAFSALARERGIAPAVLKDALEAALLAAYRRDPNVTQNAEVELDLETGTFKVFAHKYIVDEVQDPKEEISLEEAKAHREDAQVDETIAFDVTPKDFGRLAAQMAKQVITQRLRESERKILYDEYKDKQGITVIGTVQRLEGRNIVVNLGKLEAWLPGSEQIPGERWRVGERIKVFVEEVRDTPRGVQVIVSRASEGLVRELFELEVPEVIEGAVIIEGIAREAGHRTKIAVRSRDAAIDPIGACVGARGGRIQAISSELRNEKIEIIRFSPVLETYIANSLSPAKVSSVTVNEDHRQALVVVPDNMLSLAIGREGQNVRLAAKLTGYRIDIKSESQIAELERQAAEEGYEDEPETPETEEVVSGQATT
ncbi:MAG: transcription termination factor NusA [Candidatus Sericytochromatia bacterium]|nr:transcription termination factor NusA [Candidatus Sericytochromatia bacterium]